MSSDGINSITTNFASASSLNTRDLDPLIKLISSRLGVSESTAFSVLRKFMGTANANTFSDIQEFMTKFLEQGNPRQINELANDLQNLQNDPKTQEQNYKPIISRLQYGLAQNKTPVNPQQIADQDRFVASSQAKAANTNPSTQLVQSPKLFASWLVNNKAAFLTLRSNPTTTNLLLALQNPEINKSPMMLSQIAILISQLLKLKAGKSLTEDVDEVKKGELGERSRAESADHEANIVNYVKASAATTKVTALRDFLLEAERFAEEEIANIWSLTLKKEKELEKKLKAGFEKFNNSQGRKNPKK
jgi:hypothetical protein